jgi:hypothetical protein
VGRKIRADGALAGHAGKKGRMLVGGDVEVDGGVVTQLKARASRGSRYRPGSTFVLSSLGASARRRLPLN